MNGEYILHQQPRDIKDRVDYLLTLYTYACIAFCVIALALCVLLVWYGSIPAAITLFVLSTAASGYVSSTIIQRHQQIIEMTDRTIVALRSRWDELRKDADLMKFFISTDPECESDPIVRLKVRLYISTVLDMYALIIHYIQHGYFTHVEHFAIIYEGMIKSLFRYSHMREVWRDKDAWGKGCLRDEYGGVLKYTVDKVIEEIETEELRNK